MLYFTAGAARICGYICTALALIILLCRFALGLRFRKPINACFFLVGASIAVDAAHLVVDEISLRDGTASDAIQKPDFFKSHSPGRIKRGSILSLVGRMLVITACWQQIGLMLLFYARLLYNTRWVRRLIISCWILTITSYITSILMIWLECRPFHLYWQIHPNPGSCLKAHGQLLTPAISNIVIDLLLLVIAFPLLWCKRTRSEHLRVGALYTLGVFCIIITILRVVAIFASGSAQPTRSSWASIQLAVSTFVANAPTIYGDLRTESRKKSEITRRQSVGHAHSVGNHIGDNLITPKTSPLDSQPFVRPVTSRTKEWFDTVEAAA